MIKSGVRPRFFLALRVKRGEYPYVEIFPFQRHWGAIIVLAVFAVVFAIPAYTTFQEARELWQEPDDLFNLTAALFITFWLIGWSMAPLGMTALLAVLLFGREEVRARPGELEVFLGLPFVGARMTYRASGIRNLRIEQPDAASGKSWRGSHAVFDYGANQGEFGSGLSAEGLVHIRERIETCTGVKLRSGEATAEELAGRWEPEMPPRASVAQRSTPPAEEQVSPSSASSLALVAANLIPLAGAVFFGWDLGMIMLLYWAESAIIGLFNLCKIIVIGKWAALVAAPFFLGHFGGFMAGHFLFLYAFFLRDPAIDPELAGSLPVVANLFVSLWPALLAMFLSHGYSFLHNFLGRKEYLGRTVGDQMREPYSRIVFMHLVILLGGGLALALGDTGVVLIGVIVLKTAVDLRAHLKQRRESESPRGELTR